MKKSLGFTLAEVLITLAIIGVVAAMTIPSVIVNTNQAEFKTGLRKAVSVLNSSLTMNIALEGESPFDNENLFAYLQQHMNIMKSTNSLTFNTSNAAFYTTDGMRFEFPSTEYTFNAHGSDDVITFNSTDQLSTLTFNSESYVSAGTCGSHNVDISTTDTAAQASTDPCLVLVDVNGDKKPTPQNASKDYAGSYTYAQPNDALLKDVFGIMITEDRAVPLGVVAQKAMYQSQKSN